MTEEWMDVWEKGNPDDVRPVYDEDEDEEKLERIRKKEQEIADSNFRKSEVAQVIRELKRKGFSNAEIKLKVPVIMRKRQIERGM